MIPGFEHHFFGFTSWGHYKNFKEKWGEKYPTIYDIWRRNWQGIIPFLAFPSYI